jgi:hypothetical protein
MIRVLPCKKVQTSNPILFIKGENAMDLSIIADWFTVAFFLWFGLKYFIPALDKGFFPAVGAVIALAAAVFTALST